MPYLHLNTSAKLSAEAKENVRLAIAELMPILPTKTRNNTMIQIDDDCAITMGDEGLPCLFMDVRLYRASPLDAKRQFVAAVSDTLENLLDTPKNRMYINMIEMDSWGANGNFSTANE